jgi:hypothetical protein
MSGVEAEKNSKTKSMLIQAAVALVTLVAAVGGTYMAMKPTPAPTPIVEPAKPSKPENVEGPISPPSPMNVQAKVVLDAPTQARVGQLVVLDATKSIGKSITWKTEQKNFFKVDDGRKALFTAEESGEYDIVIVAENEGTVDVHVHKIKIVDPLPPMTEFQRKVKGWMTDIKHDGRKADAAKLSLSFAETAAAFKEGMTNAEIVDATKKSNQVALGDNLMKWRPFLDGIKAELNSRSAANQLQSVEDHANMWREISDAIIRVSEEW